MVSDLTERASVELAAFEWFAGRLTTQQKKPLLLEPFEREILTPTFAGVQTNVIEIPKKNGKSTIVSAVALYHLMTTKLADVVIIASSVKQADIIFNHCRKFVSMSPDLTEALVIKPGFKEIRRRDDPLSHIRVMTNDPMTLEGIEPTLAIIDEYHTHTSPEAYGIVRDGLDTREGQLLVITNAGQDEMSPFGQLRALALALPVQEVRGAYRFATNPSRSFAYSEYALEPEADVDDMATVKQANPASWMTEEMLRERLNDPGETRQRFKRFACGLWVRSEDTAILPEEWDALRDPNSVIPPGSTIWVGWDNATRGPDKTALVPLWWRSKSERVFGTPTIISAPDDGGMISDLEVTNALLEFEKLWTIEYVVYDPEAGAYALAQRLEREQGWKMAEHTQKSASLARADVRFLEAVREKTIVHNGDPEFRQHVLNAVERTVGTDGSWIFGRPKHGTRVPIDALRAASLVHHSALEEFGKDRKGVTPIFYRL
jgi:phage terminase large subunit-like protein